MNVWPLPRITFRELSTLHETRLTALITDPTVWALLKRQIDLPLAIQAEPNRTDRDYFESLGKALPVEIGAVYAVGDSHVIDGAKVIAAIGHKPLVVIPIAFGDESPLTWMASVHEGGVVKDIAAAPAEEVVIDWDTVTDAPVNRRGGGIVEVISIVTALLDWRYAAQKNRTTPETRLAPWAASIAAALAAQAIKSASIIGQGRPEGLRTLLDLMCMTVALDNQLGHRRASHGVEHAFADLVKAEPGVSRAERIAAGILLASALHNQEVAPLRTALEAAGVRLDVLKPNDIRAAANALADYARQQDLPYGILSDLTPDTDMKDVLARSTLPTAPKAS